MSLPNVAALVLSACALVVACLARSRSAKRAAAFEAQAADAASRLEAANARLNQINARIDEINRRTR